MSSSFWQILNSNLLTLLGACSLAFISISCTMFKKLQSSESPSSVDTSRTVSSSSRLQNSEYELTMVHRAFRRNNRSLDSCSDPEKTMIAPSRSKRIKYERLGRKGPSREAKTPLTPSEKSEMKKEVKHPVKTQKTALKSVKMTSAPEKPKKHVEEDVKKSAKSMKTLKTQTDDVEVEWAEQSETKTEPYSEQVIFMR